MMRPSPGLLVAAALLALVAVSTWRLTVVWRSAVAEAAQAARLERDMFWLAEVAAANARAEEARAEQATAALRAQEQASAEISRLEQSLDDLENKNAALPGADACGLDRDRVRLLR